MFSMPRFLSLFERDERRICRHLPAVKEEANADDDDDGGRGGGNDDDDKDDDDDDDDDD